MKSEDYYILYNPISGSGKSNRIIKKLSLDLKAKNKSFLLCKSQYPGHIKILCQNIREYNKLIIIGGDGTFNEAINGLMLNPRKTLPTIGFLPGGTGNAFMHDLNAETYSKAFSILLLGKTKKIDLLELKFTNNKEYALNIVGWGLVSDINILSEKLRFLGSIRYIAASIYYIFRRKARLANIGIDQDEEKGSFLFIMCLNTIHTGKAMKAAPRALLDDGLLDIILLKSNISKWKLLFLLPKISISFSIQPSILDLSSLFK